VRVAITVDGRIIIEQGGSQFDASALARKIKPVWPAEPGDPFMQIWADIRALTDDEIAALPPISVDGSKLRNPIRSPNKILGAMANYTAADGAIPETSIRKYGFFVKANSAITSPTEGVVVPADMPTLHEPELSLIIGRTIRFASHDEAREAIAAVCGSLDMTGKSSHLFSHRKSLDSFAVFDSWLTPIDEFSAPEDLHDLGIKLWINEDLRQDGSTNRLIWKPIDLVVEASRYFTLYPGDIIMCGTPSGVGPVEPGDQIRVEIERTAGFSVPVR